MNSRIMAITLFACALSVGQLAAQSATVPARASKPAWQWTDDERIAARVDPVAMKARAEARAAHLGQSHVSSQSVPASSPTAFFIDGKDNPELFLPYELFNALVRCVDSKLATTDRDAARAILKPAIQRFGYESGDFWNTLSSLVSPYLELRDRGQELETRAVKTQRPDVRSLPNDGQAFQIELCRERIVTLNAIREHFGRESFDKFLYTAIAPTLAVAWDDTGSQEAAGQRYLAGGCK